jgi:hypothetical protein
MGRKHKFDESAEIDPVSALRELRRLGACETRLELRAYALESLVRVGQLAMIHSRLERLEAKLDSLMPPPPGGTKQPVSAGQRMRDALR